MNKRGMATWQIILIILAVILLLFVLAWYADLDQIIRDLFEKIGGLFW